MFAEGALCHKKIRQLNKLMRDYGNNLLDGCETKTDWRFITKEEDWFGYLFGDGSPTRGIAASNINDDKIRRDQWGGTCITAAGRFSSFVTEVGANTTGLGWWSWVHAGGGGRSTRIIVAYQPCGQRGRRTRGETVWDQHSWYFKARGEIRDPWTMFKSDLLCLL